MRLADFECTANETHQLILVIILIPTMQFCGWSFTHLCGKSTQLCYFRRDRSLYGLEERAQIELEPKCGRDSDDHVNNFIPFTIELNC